MSDDNEAITWNVILLGESEVGKKEIFPYKINDFNSRLPIISSFITNTLEVEKNQYVRFVIWDTAGEEKYRSVNKIFYKNASVCILVYDITRKSSFEQLKNYWIKEIKEFCPKDTSNSKNIFIILIIVLVLVGNRYDRYAFQEVDNSEAKAFAKEIDAIYRCVSNKHRESIEDLYRDIGRKFLNPNYIVDNYEQIDRKKNVKFTKKLNKYINY